MALPPPLVPTRATVRGWWRDCLSGPAVAGSAADRRRVVLTQALVLATGMRIEECLAAEIANVEGHWLLLPETKTHVPRILYLSGQALAIVAALHPPAQQQTLFDAGDDQAAGLLAGWCQSLSSWHALVRACSTAGPGPYPKRHQCLRKVLSTWLYKLDPVAESAQLGHGGGVVYTHYLAVLRSLPRLLERYRMPDLGVDGFAWPEPVESKVRRPDRLYAEFRRLVSRRRS